MDFNIERNIEDYINAWKSVKNPYWDFNTEEGCSLFDKITSKMRDVLPKHFQIQYTIRSWTAQKV